MYQKNRIAPLILATIDADDVTALDWLAFDTDGIEEACFFIKITNASYIPIVVSFDGVNEHEFVGYRDSISINTQMHSSPSGDVSKIRRKNVIYVRGILEAKGGQLGNIYLSGYYN